MKKNKEVYIKDKVIYIFLPKYKAEIQNKVGLKKCTLRKWVRKIHVSVKTIFDSINLYKCKGKRIFEIVHWPFELPAN